MKKLIIIIIIFSIFLTGCGNNKHEKEVFTITSQEVYEISKKGDSNKVIIDVRTEEEYAEGHISNSVNIPLDEVDSIDVSKDKEIIVYCRSGRRSSEAALILNEMGYSVYDMGGIDSWNYELER